MGISGGVLLQTYFYSLSVARYQVIVARYQASGKSKSHVQAMYSAGKETGAIGDMKLK